MAAPRTALLCLALVVLSSCDSGGFQSAALEPPVFVQKLWVDATNGSDQNTGGELDPFRTITHALSTISPNGQVFVRPGLYDQEHGEVFPLQVPASVELIGGPLAPRASTEILGPGSGAVVELAADTRLFGFVVRNFELASGDSWRRNVDIKGPGVVVERCILREAEVGILFGNGASGALVRDNVIANNHWGMRTNAAEDVRVESNTFRHNTVGVIVSGPDVDLGGGALGGAGVNTFQCNEVHLFAEAYTNTPPYTVFVRHNYWDSLPVKLVEGDNSGWSVLAGLMLPGGEIVYSPGAGILYGPAYQGPTCP